MPQIGNGGLEQSAAPEAQEIPTASIGLHLLAKRSPNNPQAAFFGYPSKDLRLGFGGTHALIAARIGFEGV